VCFLTFRNVIINSWQSVLLDCVWNVMAHVQKPDFVFRRDGRVHLNRWGRQFSRLLAAELYALAVVMLDTPCSEAEWRVLPTHSSRQFPLHFLSCVSPRAATFQLDSTTGWWSHIKYSVQLGSKRDKNFPLPCPPAASGSVPLSTESAWWP